MGKTEVSSAKGTPLRLSGRDSGSDRGSSGSGGRSGAVPQSPTRKARFARFSPTKGEDITRSSGGSGAGEGVFQLNSKVLSRSVSRSEAAGTSGRNSAAPKTEAAHLGAKSAARLTGSSARTSGSAVSQQVAGAEIRTAGALSTAIGSSSSSSKRAARTVPRTPRSTCTTTGKVGGSGRGGTGIGSGSVSGSGSSDCTAGGVAEADGGNGGTINRGRTSSGSYGFAGVDPSSSGTVTHGGGDGRCKGMSCDDRRLVFGELSEVRVREHHEKMPSCSGVTTPGLLCCGCSANLSRGPSPRKQWRFDSLGS